jgi:hypothetical protein
MRIVLACLMLGCGLSAVCQVHHWEAVIKAENTWSYFPGTEAPGAGWQSLNFNDASWPTGSGGFGYGDNDDGTIILSGNLSVYGRKKFTIVDKSNLLRAILHVDFDDAFVVYLNGTEIFRSGIGSVGTEPVFNQPADEFHEAWLPQGLIPEAFEFTAQQLETLLVNGENILAFQVHNQSTGSSDLSSNFFLSVGVSDASETYQSLPFWFEPPISFTSSNLPIVLLNTRGQFIQDEPRIVIDMAIIDHGDGTRNSISDAPTLQTQAAIETRGESSQGFPKKSYSIETQNADGSNANLALLGMPAENDWVLYAPYTDKSMMRDVLTYHIARNMGRYASRTRYCELFLNNEYKGVYVLMEKIKRDKNRVDMASLNPEDISGDELTGGYLLRVDKIDATDYPAWTINTSALLPNENNVTLQYVDPEGAELQTAQQTYIKDYVQNFSFALARSGFAEASDNYKDYIDVDATIDFMIMNELAKNVDGYIFSTYLHKDKDSNGGKIKMGPLWDFNLCYGNVDYLANSQFAPGWTYNDPYRMFWFRRMMSDEYFYNRFTCRWREMRANILSNESINTAIDSIATVLEEAQQRNYQKWQILGIYVWPNQYIGATYGDEITWLKNWITTRADWMDDNLPEACVISGVEANAPILYPNPGSNFQLKPLKTGQKINILDVLGKLVYSGISTDTFTWDGTDASGNEVPTGVYLVQVDEKILYRFIKID